MVYGCGLNPDICNKFALCGIIEKVGKKFLPQGMVFKIHEQTKKRVPGAYGRLKS